MRMRNYSVLRLILPFLPIIQHFPRCCLWWVDIFSVCIHGGGLVASCGRVVGGYIVLVHRGRSVASCGRVVGGYSFHVCIDSIEVDW